MTDTPTPDEHACKRCGAEYTLHDGMEPTPYCHDCAHTLVETLERDFAACRVALQAADAMRDAAVKVMQTHCIPDSGITDSEVVEQMYEIFDGPLQRAYDTARALVGQEGEVK